MRSKTLFLSIFLNFHCNQTKERKKKSDTPRETNLNLKTYITKPKFKKKIDKKEKQKPPIGESRQGTVPETMLRSRTGEKKREKWDRVRIKENER